MEVCPTTLLFVGPVLDHVSFWPPGGWIVICSPHPPVLVKPVIIMCESAGNGRLIEFDITESPLQELMQPNISYFYLSRLFARGRSRTARRHLVKTQCLFAL